MSEAAAEARQALEYSNDFLDETRHEFLPLAKAREHTAACLTAALDGMVWRGMESAEKDYWVLVDIGGVTALAFYYDEDGKFYLGNGITFNADEQSVVEPRHWLPLPAPPATDGGT